MKLAAKLVSLVILLFTTLLIVDSYLLVDRERDLLESHSREDALASARVLRTVIAAVAESGGQQRAEALVDDLNRSGQLESRWLTERTPGEVGRRYPLTQRQVAELADTGVATLQDRAANRRFTLIHTNLGTDRTGILELSESLSPLSATERSFRVRVLALSGAVLLVGMLLTVVAGTRLLGKPLSELARHAKRIGEGDLAARLWWLRSDELGELSSAMNQMCESLAQAREKAQQETEARIGALRQLRHEDRLRTVGRLAAGIAHELGTPLNIVSGRAAMIASGRLRSE